ncbi:uracil-DNA glycosylase family protein [Marivirga sp. S37H4]|uniref:Uracil-DNA glycosylase family protein n=1 Tax=Marivirga aurantiaca TaxID=2802615 RepID=A0A935C7W3_9BACT|nr:uracil-DNA glycosylase family protein [Marivirga aurantiaca]MBK6265165.1 uracil-DNA glycosylase family protein [Marivirga aurantiaca]
MANNINKLLQEIKGCNVCKNHLPHGANPVLTAGVSSRIVVVGQAPGRAVHETGIPWNDKSGDNLRSWMGVGKSIFYNTHMISLIPAGFCYPGTGKNGDLPPRKECAPMWHQKLLNEMGQVELIILAGQYAQKHYLNKSAKGNLTATVQNFEEYLPKFFPLPHPSPRNNIWQAKNRWFKAEVLPVLKNEVNRILSHK